MEGRRKRSSKEKLEILLEGLSSESGVAEVCRRRGITPTQFYLWKKRLLKSAERVFRDGKEKGSRREEKLAEEVGRLKSVIAEITTENLDLKKTLGG
jgi:transposase-like protein